MGILFSCFPTDRLDKVLRLLRFVIRDVKPLASYLPIGGDAEGGGGGTSGKRLIVGQKVYGFGVLATGYRPPDTDSQVSRMCFLR